MPIKLKTVYTTVYLYRGGSKISKDSVRNIIVIFQTNNLIIFGLYVRHSATVSTDTLPQGLFHNRFTYIFHSRNNCSYFGNGVAKTFKNYNCSQNWTAFIVPFRKREEHLPHFLKAITKHQLNNSQENNYEILIIEQGHHLLWILEL